MPRRKSKELEDEDFGEFTEDGGVFQEYDESMEAVTPESGAGDDPPAEAYPYASGYGEETPAPAENPGGVTAESGAFQCDISTDETVPEEAAPDEAGSDEAAPDEYAELLQEMSGPGLVPSGVDGAEPLTLEEISNQDTEPADTRTDETSSLPVEETGEGEMAGTPATRRRDAPESARVWTGSRQDRVLTIDARDEVQTEAEQEAILWHEIQNAHWTRRILTGTLDGVERTESGMTVATVSYKGFRVAIPVKEMLLHSGRLPTGEEYQALMERLRRILTARLGSEIDFIIMGHENRSRSVVGSRRAAMYRKRQNFYLDTNEMGKPMIYEGRVVQARVVAVAEKIIRVEIFGVECPIVARGLSNSWIGSAADNYSVGDRILVRILSVSGDSVENLSVAADVRSVSGSSAGAELKKCVVQGRYAGKVTDIRSGVVFIRLNNGVNAIAHSCYDRRTPGKRDDVSFSVTRLDEEQGVAIGMITRIIKQNL